MKFFHLVLYLMRMLNGKTTNLKVWWLVLQNTQCTVWLSPHLDGLRWWTCHCWPPRSQQSPLFSSALSNRKNCTDQTQHDLNQCSTVLGCLINAFRSTSMSLAASSMTRALSMPASLLHTVKAALALLTAASTSAAPQACSWHKTRPATHL